MECIVPWLESWLLTFPTIFGDDLVLNNCGNLNENDVLNILTIWKDQTIRERLIWFDSKMLICVVCNAVMQFGRKITAGKQVCNRKLIVVRMWNWFTCVRTRHANERTNKRRCPMESLERTERLLTSPNVFYSRMFSSDLLAIKHTHTVLIHAHELRTTHDQSNCHFDSWLSSLTALRANVMCQLS